jgi:hypothetical protein
MSRFVGPILQNGYVVRDWRAAARHWVDVLGVGPFFVMEHVQFRESRYRGQPSAIDMTVAIAYSGEQQIELVQQHNDAPSIYRDFLLRVGEGLQHIGALTPDVGAALDANRWRDRILQDGVTRIGQHFAYVDTVGHDGTMLELIEATPKILAAFQQMNEAARTWDGTDPIRISR